MRLLIESLQWLILIVKIVVNLKLKMIFICLMVSSFLATSSPMKSFWVYVEGRVKKYVVMLIAMLVLGTACDSEEKAPAKQSPTEQGASAQAARVEGAKESKKDTATNGLEKLVVLGGSMTEVVYALGAGDKVIAADVTSTYPKQVEELPRLGYYRKTSAEGVLALEPRHIIMTSDAGPAEAIEQIKKAGVNVHTITQPAELEQTRAMITKLGDLLGEPDGAKELVAKLDADLDEVAKRRDAHGAEKAPKVLFVYARGKNVLMVSGSKTPAAEMLTLAGAKNTVTAFEGFKPLTPEAVATASPDFIVMPAKGAASLGGPDAVFELPGLALTPAAKSKSLVLVDDLALLGFGPRVGEALLELQDKLGVASEAPKR